MADIIEILAIITPIITFWLGMLYQNHKIKKSNIREKAMKLNEEIMKDLKNHSLIVKKQIIELNYISFVERKNGVTFEIHENFNFLFNYSIFKIKDNKITLTYQRDRILKKHADIIIENIEKYRLELSFLENNINKLNISNVPPDFENNLRELIKDLHGRDDLDRGERLNEFLFISYVVAISGSKNSYKSGRTCIIDIIKKRYDDLQDIVKSNSNSMNTFVRIEYSLNTILSSLDNIVYEIEYLEEDWQNKLII